MTKLPNDRAIAAPTANEAEIATSTRIQFYFFFLYLMLKPFYLWAAGQPQVADFLVVLLLVINIFSYQGRLSSGISPILLIGGLLVFYIATVNLTWAALRNDLRMGMIGSFYVFNFLLFFMVINLADRFGKQFFKYLVLGLFFSVILQALLSLGFQNAGLQRQIMFFTNPNQLGYYALLSATLYAACTPAFPMKTIYQIIFYLCALYLAALSLSKAALISFAFLFTLRLLRKPLHLAAVAIVFVGFILVGSEFKIVQNVENRISNIGQQEDDSISEGARGYGRIFNYSQYLIAGAAERGLDRFEDEDHEFHSTLGTILFSYGVIGFSIFSLLIYRILKFSGFGYIIYFVPPFLFGLTHQGFRFSFLWVLFGVLVALPKKNGEPGLALIRSVYGDKPDD